MTPRFHVTFDTTTPESADAGEYAESGFAHPGGWRFPVDDPGPHELSLHDAVRAAGAGSFEDVGRWFTSVDPNMNYYNGENTFFNIHPPKTITPASYGRLRRLLCKVR